MNITGADVMARALYDGGIRVVAGIPGHSVAGLANAVGRHGGLVPMLVRHEAVGAFAADVHYRISGRMMAMFVHAFPGLTNGIVGVANAYADSSPLLVISGQTASALQGRGAYQEFARQQEGDTAQLLRHAVKRVWQPRAAVDLADRTWAALRLAVSGRPGPVALDVTEELWDEVVSEDAIPSTDGYLFDARTRPRADSTERVFEMLLEAERPLLVAGQGVLLGRAQSQLRAVAERLGLPVATTAAGKSAFPEDHPLSVGLVGWTGTSVGNYAARNADLVISLGARLSETTASSWQPGITFTPGTTAFVQVDAEPGSIANSYPAEEALIGDVALALEDLLALADGERRPDETPYSAWWASLDEERRRWSAIVEESRVPGERGRIGVGHVLRELERVVANAPINLVPDVGKHHKWVLQQYTSRADDRVVSSIAGGAMGYGAAGAIGAAMARPETRTVSWNGDGGMSMMLPAWLTAAEYELPITFVVLNDQAYGAVANIQEREYGSTVYSEFDAAGKRSEPFAFDAGAVAAGCGIPARVVEDPAGVGEALAWAHQADGPTVVDIRCDRKSVVPSGGGVYLHDYWNHRALPPVVGGADGA